MVKKYHKIASVIIASIYTIGFWRMSGPDTVFRFLIPAFVVFCVAASYYNKKYLLEIGKYNFWVMLRPLLLFISGFGILSLLPTPTLRVLFLIVTFFVITLVELSLGNFAENILVNETLVISFGFFIALTGYNQDFPLYRDIVFKLGHWQLLNWQFSMEPIYLLGIFVSTLLTTRCFYEFIPQGEKTKWVAATVLALFCCELFWALSFLPPHYSASAFILFCIYYFCLILNYYYLFHSLTLKKIQFHLMLIVLACAIVIVATPWKAIQ